MSFSRSSIVLTTLRFQICAFAASHARMRFSPFIWSGSNRGATPLKRSRQQARLAELASQARALERFIREDKVLVQAPQLRRRRCMGSVTVRLGRSRRVGAESGAVEAAGRRRTSVRRHSMLPLLLRKSTLTPSPLVFTLVPVPSQVQGPITSPCPPCTSLLPLFS